jgi:signal transduction histidine kinase
VDNVPNGVLVLFDTDLRYRIVGPETLPAPELDPAEMVGQRVDALFPEDVVSLLEPELDATLDGDTRSFDVEYQSEIHHIETRPVDIDGDRYGVLLSQVVTDVRQTEQELLRANERLDQFASMVSHDVSNALTVAMGRLDLYRETHNTTYLDDLEEALERIDDLTSGLATLARSRNPIEEKPLSISVQ